jgi:HSP20 family protein
MANLVRREHVFDDLFDLRRNFDHMINRLFSSSGSFPESRSEMLVTAPPIESWIDEEGKKYHLKVAVPPGMDPKEVQLTLQGNNLTVSGEHKSEREKKKGSYLQQEFSYGRFDRTIELPEGVDTNELSAEYNNGALEIVAALKASALPKRIEVKSSAKAKGAGAQ